MSSRSVYPNNRVKRGVRQNLFLNKNNIELKYINLLVVRELGEEVA